MNHLRAQWREAGARGDLPPLEWKVITVTRNYLDPQESPDDPLTFTQSELLAKADGKWVGRIVFTHHTRKSYLGPAGTIAIDGLEVIRDYRRRGIATAMMRRLESMFPGQPIHHGNFLPDGAKWYQHYKTSAGTTYYHASPYRLEPGTVLTPGATRGMDNFPDRLTPGNRSVYMSDDLAEAMGWAAFIANSTRPPHRKMFIYEVEAMPLAGEYAYEFLADEARVVRLVKEMDGLDLDAAADDWMGVRWAKVARGPNILTAYRGVTLELKPWEARPILEAIAKGATRLLADEFIRAMAKGGAGVDWMSGGRGQSYTTAGRWWTTNENAAWQYAGGCSMPWAGRGEPGNILFGVVMEADLDESVGDIDVSDYHRWWHLEPGTPLVVRSFTVDVPTRENAAELVRILDKQGAWDDVEGWFDPFEWEQGDINDTQMLTLPIPPMKTEALPSWRPYQNDRPFWHWHDVVVATDRAGSRRSFEVWVDGTPFTRAPTLAEAKARVEAKLGPLRWKMEKLPLETVVHYYFGPTTEFTDPTIIYWADRGT